MSGSVRRPGVQAGYDRWAERYDATPNPVVALDRRHALGALRPAAGERILDAGCGTGAHLARLAAAGSAPVGIDFSRGMLRVARRTLPGVPLARADLNRRLPVAPARFDAVLFSLVGEHLGDLGCVFREAFDALRRGGRLVFSVFHPEMAAAGVEANFEHAGVEYRLGAERYSLDDYLERMDDAGFRELRCREHRGDESLAAEVPGADKYLGRPLLAVIEALRPGPARP